LNKIRSLVGVVLLGVLTLGVGGVILAHIGLEEIVLVYLFSALGTMVLSTILVARAMEKPASLFFARYM
jgi:hypothetical protein